MPETRDEIVAEISAQDVSGQIAVGSHILQVVADHGAIVNVPGQTSTPRTRPTPVAIRPRDAAGLLGREQELQAAQAVLADGMTVAFVGPAGIGKTSLLRRLAQLALPALEHGVVFTRAAGEPIADVERFLFDAFYETDEPYQPTSAELLNRLADRRALVVLDDLEHERDDVGELLDSAPGCVFVLASTRRCLWGEGRVRELAGLDAETALALLERELGRELRPDERASAVELCRLLGGRPLSLLHAAALAREGDLPLGDPDQLAHELRAGLGDEEQRVMHALALLAPAAVHVDDVAAIAGVSDAGAVLERLRAAGIAQAHCPRWSLTLAFESSAPAGPADDALLARASVRFADGSERPVEDVAVLLALLRALGAARRWSDVVALVRSADARLTLSGRWGAWELALEHAYAASRENSDRRTTAWALHQLGTRTGCLGDVEAGSAVLTEALELRRELGETRGAAVTAHNLARLRGDTPRNGGSRDDPEKPDPPKPSPLRALATGALGLAVGVGAALLIAPQHDSTATLTPANVAVSQPTVTRTVTVPGPTTAAATQTVTVSQPARIVTQTVTQTVTMTVPAPPPPPPVIR